MGVDSQLSNDQLTHTLGTGWHPYVPVPLVVTTALCLYLCPWGCLYPCQAPPGPWHQLLRRLFLPDAAAYPCPYPCPARYP